VDYYKILDIENTASFKDVKKSYKKLADKYHPDRMGHLNNSEREEYAEKMKLINEAKDTLADPVKRFKFDQKLGIDIYKDLRKLNSFMTEATVSRVGTTGENFYNGDYSGESGYSYDRDGGGYGRPAGENYNPSYYDSGQYQTTPQGTYGGGAQDRFYETGQRYQNTSAEKQTYMCPYCNKKFRMVVPKDIMITACPTCKNDITIYPE
jgi:curved DNA-binding protein CbpA